MKKVICFFTVLITIFLIQLPVFAENEFQQIGGWLTIEKNKNFTIDLFLINDSSLFAKIKKGVTISFGCTGKQIPYLSVNGIEFDDDKNCLAVTASSNRISRIIVDSIIIGDQFYSIGELYLNIVEKYDYMSNPIIELGLFFNREIPKSTRKNFNIANDKKILEIIFIISFAEDRSVEIFSGLDEYYTNNILMTSIEIIGVDGKVIYENISEGYERRVNFHLKKNLNMSITYIMEDLFDNYIFQPKMKIKENDMKFLGHILSI